ncbi:acyltransferase [Pelomonas sp. APW6]|uniref:Acyltransferase n=1 Tax=Roseateles subflavus TaxID=3053353 RepID=A0ABT7LD42_9BURK|nr:acyltransferase [Pelomonas sp. APW6]MDL5030779.1 acyltransferase [Pelomonas sp. APW6]
MSPSRAPGLDTLRALAIILVFSYHYRVFVSATPDLGWLSNVGWSGVDLFFVLSGYLIGEQLMAGLARGETLSLRSFYARRAARTWPLFWLVLAAYFLLPGVLGGREPPPLWRFLTFTQNIELTPGTAFSHAWSLCVEEQFYLLLPLVLLAARALRLSRRQAWLGIAGLTLAAIAWRSHLWTLYGRSEEEIIGYYQHIYYATLGRADEFLPGLAVALLQHGHPQQWARLMRQGRRLLVLGLAAVGLMWTVAVQTYRIPDVGWGYFMTGFGYSAMAWAYALLLVACLAPGHALSRRSLPGARSLALWSYAIYLTHKPLAHVMQPLLQGWPDWAAFGLTALASVALGAALYHAVERPVMRWRQRRWPSQFRPAAPLGARTA